MLQWLWVTCRGVDPAPHLATLWQTQVAVWSPYDWSFQVTQRLHLVFGGDLIDPSETVFKDVNDIHIVGMFPDYDSAHKAWKAEAQRTVDNAHTRYFIAHIHRLLDEEQPGSATQALGT